VLGVNREVALIDPLSRRAGRVSGGSSIPGRRYPDGSRFTYGDDPADRIAWLEKPWNERTSFSDDAAGRRTLKKLGNGTRATFTYDAAGRLTNLGNLKSDASVVSSFDYQYDPADNRTAVLEADGSHIPGIFGNPWDVMDAGNQLPAESRSLTSPSPVGTVGGSDAGSADCENRAVTEEKPCPVFLPDEGVSCFSSG
jgi:YD repeat-containing protein